MMQYKKESRTMKFSIIFLIALLCCPFEASDVTAGINPIGSVVRKSGKKAAQKEAKKSAIRAAEHSLTNAAAKRPAYSVSRKAIETKALQSGARTIPEFCRTSISKNLSKAHTSSIARKNAASEFSRMRRVQSGTSPYCKSIQRGLSKQERKSYVRKLAQKVDEFNSAKTVSEQARSALAIRRIISQLPIDEQTKIIAKCH